MTRKKQAMEYFLQGYNCCQSVVLAFKDVLDIDEKTLIKISGSFGGGIGRLREVCGAVSGMAMVLGLLDGYEKPEETEKKAELYEKIQSLAKDFEKENGSIICRQLLHLDVEHDEPVPEKRTAAYYHSRPCGDLVGYAAELLEDYLENR